jgi:hypothetical protein
VWISEGAVPELIDTVREQFAKRSYPFFTKPYDLTVFGVRGASDVANLFDDRICAARWDGNRWDLKVWVATTDPGRPHLENPMRKEGCFVLPPGRVPGMWRKGLHKGKPALVQATTVMGWRDADRDLELDPVRIFRKGLTDSSVTAPALFRGDGVNCHRAGADSPKVELWSAGCQVMKRSKSMDELLAMVDAQTAHGLGDVVSYVLFDVVETPALEAVFAAKAA